jgi:hypothetical protein
MHTRTKSGSLLSSFSYIQIIITNSWHLHKSGKSCKQVIIPNNSIINHYSCHWVIYVKAVTRQVVTHIRESRRFESMYTLQRKTRPIRHTLSMLGPRMAFNHTYLKWSTYSNLSWSHQQIWTDPLLLRIRAPDITPSPIEWSTDPYPASLPNQPLKQWGKTKIMLITGY